MFTAPEFSTEKKVSMTGTPSGMTPDFKAFKGASTMEELTNILENWADSKEATQMNEDPEISFRKMSLNSNDEHDKTLRKVKSKEYSTPIWSKACFKTKASRKKQRELATFAFKFSTVMLFIVDVWKFGKSQGASIKKTPP